MKRKFNVTGTHSILICICLLFVLATAFSMIGLNIDANKKIQKLETQVSQIRMDTIELMKADMAGLKYSNKTDGTSKYLIDVANRISDEDFEILMTKMGGLVTNSLTDEIFTGASSLIVTDLQNEIYSTVKEQLVMMSEDDIELLTAYLERIVLQRVNESLQFMQSSLSSNSTLLSGLQQKVTKLESRVAALEISTKGLNAGIAETVTKLEKLVEKLQQGMVVLENKVNESIANNNSNFEMIDGRIKNLNTTLNYVEESLVQYIAGENTDITNNLTELINNLKNEINITQNQIWEALENDDSETLSLLTAKLEELNGMLESLENNNAQAISELDVMIQNLQTSTYTSFTEMRTEVSNGLQNLQTEYQGALSEETNARISAIDAMMSNMEMNNILINSNMQTMESGLENRIAAGDNAVTERMEAEDIRLSEEQTRALNSAKQNLISQLTETKNGLETEFNSQITELDTRLVNMDASTTNALNLLDESIALLENTTEENLEEAKATITENLNALQTDYRGLISDETSQRISAVTSLTTTVASNKTAIEQSLSSAKSSLQTDINTLKTNVNTLNTSVNTAKTDIGTIKTDVSTLKSNVGTAQTDISSLKNRVTALENAGNSSVSYSYDSSTGTLSITTN